MGHYRGKRGRQSEKGALRSLSRWASLTGSGTIHHFPELSLYKSSAVIYGVVHSQQSSSTALQNFSSVIPGAGIINRGLSLSTSNREEEPTAGVYEKQFD